MQRSRTTWLAVCGSFVLVLCWWRPCPPAAAAEAGGRTAQTADFYVAPDGNATNPGTESKPLATIVQARDAARKKIAAGLTGNLAVLLRGGVYEQTETLTFGPEDSGTETFSITYAAYPGENVTLSGGRKITGWKPGEGEIWTAELPEVKAGKWYFRQLFVNGRRAIRARTPNQDDKLPWWKIKTSNAQPGAPDQNSTPITVSVDHPIRAWKNIADLELIYLNNNDGSRKRVGAVNETEQTCTLPAPHQWPPNVLPGEYQIGHPVPPYACYFENALELLDGPGQWYLDRQTGVLSYWPRPGENLKAAEVIAPVVQNTLLAVVGTRENPVRNLHFKGIHIEHVDRPLPPSGFTAMFGCLQVINHIHHVTKTAVDGAGIYVSFPHEGSGAAIRGNLIHDLVRNPFNPRGAGGWDAAGIYLDGVRPDLGCRNYRIENNIVYQTSNPLFFCQAGKEGNTWKDNVFLGNETPPKDVLEAIQAKAGLEPAYRKKFLP